jgi:hypothetical protein
MVDLGILVGNEKEVTDLKAKVIAGYSATFFNKL